MKRPLTTRSRRPSVAQDNSLGAKGSPGATTVQTYPHFSGGLRA